MTGIYYQVKPGDTLMKISRTYKVSPKKLAEINQISQPEQLLAGSVLFIPDAEQIAEPPSPTTVLAPDDGKARVTEPPASISTPPGKVTAEKKGALPPPGYPGKKPAAQQEQTEAPSSAPPPVMRKTPVSQPLWPPAPPAPMGKIPPAASKEDDLASVLPKEMASVEKGIFTWPVKGKVVNRFGQQPNGMYFNHIRIVAKENTPVTTAAQGTVIFSAPLKEFGETVIIKHDARFATVYTHLDNRLVKVDQRIKKGDQIGLVGKSEVKGEGYIHFEIRDHNKSRNPLLFLP